MDTWVIILLLVFGLVLVYGVWTFNRLVSLGARADGSWSDIDVQLKKRWDLVPSLVETVRGYASHERATLEEVVEARSKAKDTSETGARAAAESRLTGGVHRIFALAEDYPDLKADEMYRKLHDQLVDVENDLESARRYYNAVVRDLNTLVAQFPSSLVAGVSGRRAREFFELDAPSERSAPSAKIGG